MRKEIDPNEIRPLGDGEKAFISEEKLSELVAGETINDSVENPSLVQQLSDLAQSRLNEPLDTDFQERKDAVNLSIVSSFIHPEEDKRTKTSNPDLMILLDGIGKMSRGDITHTQAKKISEELNRHAENGDLQTGLAAKLADYVLTEVAVKPKSTSYVQEERLPEGNLIEESGVHSVYDFLQNDEPELEDESTQENPSLAGANYIAVHTPPANTQPVRPTLQQNFIDPTDRILRPGDDDDYREANRTLDPQQRSTDLQAQQLERQTELVMQGKAGFFRDIFAQEITENRRPPESSAWWKRLTKEEEKTAMIVSYKMLKLLEAKKNTDEGLKEYIKRLNIIERKEIKSLTEMPGFRIALSTISRELYQLDTFREISPEHKRVSLTRFGKNVFSTDNDESDLAVGIAPITYEEYKQNLVERMTHHFMENPDLIGFNLLQDSSDVESAAQEAAQVYAGMALNFYSMLLVNEAADDDRMISTGLSEVLVPKHRIFLHPYREAKEKWMPDNKTDFSRFDPQDLFGRQGVAIASFLEIDRDFREAFRNYAPEASYYLHTMAGSGVDHIKYKSQQTMAEVLLDRDNIRQIPGTHLYEYANPDLIMFSEIDDEAFASRYRTILNNVAAINDITMNAPEKLDKAKLTKAVRALKSLATDKDPIIRALYSDKVRLRQLVLNMFGSAAGGFVPYGWDGTKHTLILSFDEDDQIIKSTKYDNIVSGLIANNQTQLNEILREEGMNNWSVRQDIINELNALDVDKRVGGVIDFVSNKFAGNIYYYREQVMYRTNEKQRKARYSR